MPSTLNEFLEKALSEEKRIDEALASGHIDALFKTAHGFLDDLKTMVGYGNQEGAIKLMGVIQKNVMRDLLKAIKAMDK